MADPFGEWAVRWRVTLGFALGIAYLIFAQPTWPLLIAGTLMALAGLAVRGYASGFLEKGRRLAVSGPYARTRNPLYLGSFLMGLGFSVASARWLLGGAFLIYFLAIYWPVMNREAKELRRHFGEAYEVYARNVPLFFPEWRISTERGEGFQRARYRANREYHAALGFIAAVIFLALKAYVR